MRENHPFISLLIRVRFLLFLSLAAIFTFWMASDHVMVDNYFSNGVYALWVRGIPYITSFFPFSLGDIIYAAFFVFLIFYSFAKFKKRRDDTSKGMLVKLRQLFLRVFQFSLVVYLVFLWVWGLNYFRSNPFIQFDLKEKRYSKSELIRLNESLLSDIKQSKPKEKLSWDQTNQVIRKAYDSAGLIGMQQSERLKVKKSFLGKWIAYLGISGYFNPFTGEAQIDASYPIALRSFVAAHEIAHQLGYAKEDEANFLGFLASEHTNDSSLKYSTLVQMFLYANNALYDTDSLMAVSLQKKLSEDARRDIKSLLQYYNSRKNPIEPMISKMYGWFLKSHQQPQGLITYREVLSLVIGYYRKHHWK